MMSAFWSSLSPLIEDEKVRIVIQWLSPYDNVFLGTTDIRQQLRPTLSFGHKPHRISGAVATMWRDEDNPEGCFKDNYDVYYLGSIYVSRLPTASLIYTQPWVDSPTPFFR